MKMYPMAAITIQVSVNNTICAKIYELRGTELRVLKDVEKPSSFKCGTFGASSLTDRKIATGDFNGRLQMWDLESIRKPVIDVQAHASIVNAIDGCGGQVGHLEGVVAVQCR